MNSHYDYKRFAILYIDDELQSLKYFKSNFEGKFQILTAPDAKEGWTIFEQNRDIIGLIITDQRMPGETGVQFLEKVRARKPKTIRILATAYSDFDAAIAAVNSGAIYKYVSKPWDTNELEVTLMRGLEFFIVQNERDQLLREKISALHRVMMTDRLISLGLLASGLSHHLRNSLVAIKVFLDLAPEKLEGEVRIEDLQDPNYWVEFYRSVQKQMSKTTELLDALGAVPLTVQDNFDCSQKLSEVIQQAFVEKKKAVDWIGREIRVVAASDEPVTRLNKKLILRFFDLFLSTLASQIAVTEEVLFSVHKAVEGGTKIMVSAKGLKFPDNALKHLFDPFYVKDTEGTNAGLNLLTCFFIIYHHGGQMAVTKMQNEEAVYEIILPENPDTALKLNNEEAFLNKVFSTEAAWERLLVG